MGGWLLWSGTHWAPDRLEAVVRLAKQTARRRLFRTLGKASVAIRSATLLRTALPGAVSSACAAPRRARAGVAPIRAVPSAHRGVWVMPHARGQPLLLPHFPLDEVTLRPLRTSDAADWYAYLRDPRVVEHTSFAITALTDVAALVQELLAGAVRGSDARFAIARTRDDVLIGTIGLHDPQQGTMELGYDLA